MTTEPGPHLEWGTESSGEADTRLADAVRGSVQFREAMQQVVPEEQWLESPRERAAGLPPSEMGAVMAGMEALRREIALPPEVVNELLQEHRRDFGRG